MREQTGVATRTVSVIVTMLQLGLSLGVDTTVPGITITSDNTQEVVDDSENVTREMVLAMVASRQPLW